jgi:NAD(P)H-hydrate epimerase
MAFPILTREQSRQLDRLAVEQYGMSSLILMENAGRGLADTLEELGIPGLVVICCGRGNNAGDGFVLARHLDLRGHRVRVLLWGRAEQLRGDAAANFHILQKSDVPIEEFGERHDPERLQAALEEAAWIVDALLGTGVQGEPRPPLDAVIDQLNAAAAPKLAVDLPTGLDCDRGLPSVHTIRAAHTCTFAAAKPGFFAPEARPYLGQLHVLDIGVPRKLLETMLADDASGASA